MIVYNCILFLLSTESFPPPPSALTLDAFVTLVNLVYSFPYLVLPKWSVDSALDPLLPIGGVVDHLLLRLTAALQLTQILLLLGPEEASKGIAKCSTPATTGESMEVDRVADDANDREKQKLLECWRRLRHEAGLPVGVSNINSICSFICSLVHSFCSCCYDVELIAFIHSFIHSLLY